MPVVASGVWRQHQASFLDASPERVEHRVDGRTGALRREGGPAADGDRPRAAFDAPLHLARRAASIGKRLILNPMSNMISLPDEGDSVNKTDTTRRGIALFRGKDAPGLFKSGTMSFPVFDPEDQKALQADGPRSENIVLGSHDAVLFRGDGDEGFSLVKVSFAPHYVLPRHTHDADCLYYVAEGSLVMGSQVLEAGDGFFVPSDAPYAYEAGPDGVVVLEFRTRTSFGMNIPGGQVDRLRRMATVADEQGDEWAAFNAKHLGRPE